MISKWINSLAKKIAISKLNSTLEQYKDNVMSVRTQVNIWIGRLERIISCLKSFLAKLDDNKLTAEEIDQTVEDVKTAVRQM